MKYNFNYTGDSDLGVDYDELHPSPEVTVGEHGWEITKTLRCAWADRYALMRKLLGRRQNQNTIVTPHMITDADGNETSYLWCRHVGLKGWKDPSGGSPTPSAREQIPAGQGEIEYTFAEVTARYDDGPWFMDERLDLAGEVVALQGGKQVDLYWHDDHELVDKQLVQPLFSELTGVWKVTFFALRYVPEGVFTNRGKINTVAMKSARIRTIDSQGNIGYRTFAIGEVLYQGASQEESYVPFGRKASPIYDVPYIRVDMEFGINENTWNKFFRPGEEGSKAWDSLDLDVAGNTPYTPYPTTDLRGMLGIEI